MVEILSFVNLLTIVEMLSFVKGWLAIATLKPTFTFIGKDFAK